MVKFMLAGVLLLAPLLKSSDLERFSLEDGQTFLLMSEIGPTKVSVSVEGEEYHIRVESTSEKGAYPAAHLVVKKSQIANTTWIEKDNQLILILDDDGDGLADRRLVRDFSNGSSKLERITHSFEDITPKK
jgi:hypothetical protein